MNESKIDITHRLQKDGRWAEASKFKDDYIAKLRGEGMTRREAQANAWAAMEQKYPPIMIVTKLMQTIAELTLIDDELREPSEGSLRELVAELLWVCYNLNASDIAEDEAPSASAWALLERGRQNQDNFLSALLPEARSIISKITAAISRHAAMPWPPHYGIRIFNIAATGRMARRPADGQSARRFCCAVRA